MMMDRVVGGAHTPDVLTVLSDSSCCSAGSSFRELDDVFLQTQARIWLGEVLHTRLDEETAIADLLADGKLLFQVSRAIWKMLLTKCMERRYSKAYIYESNISGKCSGRYMPYSNVDSFLKICQILGLTGVDLFSPSDVVEKRDIRRVCMCIRSLSKKARSKNLIVPDFDIVTYTIAMPTDVVRCIRRSLEQSQCSGSSSSSGNPFFNLNVKYRRQNQNEDYARSYDSYSEESDDAESDFRILPYRCPDSNASDTATVLSLDLEKSLGVSEIAENCFLTRSVIPSDTEDQEVDGFDSQYGSVCVMASMGSFNTEHQRNVNPDFFSIHPDAFLNHLRIEALNDPNARELYINRKGVGHTLENSSMSFCNVRTPPSVVGNSMDATTSEGSYASQQFDISELNGHRTDSCYSVLSDREANGRIFMIDNGSSSNHRASKYVLGRRLSDEMEDAEVSSTASLNSVSGKVVTLDYEDGFEAELDSTNVIIDSPEFQNLENDQMDVRLLSGPKFYDTVELQNHEDMVTPETDGPQGNLKCVNGMNSTNAFQPTVDWKRFFTMENKIHVGTHAFGVMYDRDSAVAQADNKVLSNFNATLNSENILSNVKWNQLDVVLSSQSDSPCNILALSNEKDQCLMTMVSNEGNSVAADSELVMPRGLYPNFVCHSPTKASGDALQLDNTKSLDNTDNMSIDSKSGADIDARKHLSISLSTTCLGKDTEVSCEALSAGSTVARNEMNPEVLEVQNCYKYLVLENNLNCSLKQMFQDGMGRKNNPEEKIVLNKFSTLTRDEERVQTSPLSLETSCFPRVNPSGIMIGLDSEKIVLDVRNSISTATWCHKSSLFDIIATPDLMIHEQDGVNMVKHIQLVYGDARSTESDSCMWKMETMGSPMGSVEVRDACSKLSDGLGIRNFGHQETRKTITILEDKHAVHTSDFPVSQSMLTVDNQPYSSVACLEEIGKEENSEHLLKTTLQVFDGACVNCDKEVAYCTKHMDEGKGKHGKLTSRTDEFPEVSEHKLGKKLLLRSIAGGVTLFGGILLFLHFRRKGSREKIGETSVPSTQTRKASSLELSTRKVPKRDGTNRIYPVDRLGFQD